MVDFYSPNIQQTPLFWDLTKAKPVNTSPEKNTEVITVPLAAKQPVKTQVPLTPEGNVPIKHLVNRNSYVTSFEKSIDNSYDYLLLNKEKEHEEDAKVDGLCKEIPGYCVLKDNKARSESLVNNRFNKFKNKEEQLADFQRLNSKIKTTSDIDILAGTIPDLQKENQTGASDDMLGNKRLKSGLRTYSDNSVVRNTWRCHPDNQLVIQEQALKKASKETKTLLARETPKFAEENQVQATKNIVATGDEDIINAEAEVAHETGKNNSKIQLDVTKTLCESGFEKVQNTIAKNEGKYATENQIPIYTMLATSEHQSVVEEAARYIYTMQKENQLPAINITKEINNEGALRAAASQFNKYAQENQEAIKSSLMNTDYYSVKQEVMNQESIKQDTADTSETTSVSSAEENSRAEDNAKVINEVSEIINSNEPNKTELLENVIKNASKTQKLTILRQCPNVDVIEALLNSNPSLDVLSEIMDLLGKGKFDDRNKRKLVNAIYKSGVFKGFNQESQIIFINNLDSENLKYIDINNLSPDAKKVYDERLKDLQIREQTDISCKFSGFGLLKRTA